MKTEICKLLLFRYPDEFSTSAFLWLVIIATAIKIIS